MRDIHGDFFPFCSFIFWFIVSDSFRKLKGITLTHFALENPKVVDSLDDGNDKYNARSITRNPFFSILSLSPYAGKAARAMRSTLDFQRTLFFIGILLVCVRYTSHVHLLNN